MTSTAVAVLFLASSLAEASIETTGVYSLGGDPARVVRLIEARDTIPLPNVAFPVTLVGYQFIDENGTVIFHEGLDRPSFDSAGFSFAHALVPVTRLELTSGEFLLLTGVRTSPGTSGVMRPRVFGYGARGFARFALPLDSIAGSPTSPATASGAIALRQGQFLDFDLRTDVGDLQLALRLDRVDERFDVATESPDCLPVKPGPVLHPPAEDGVLLYGEPTRESEAFDVTVRPTSHIDLVSAYVPGLRAGRAQAALAPDWLNVRIDGVSGWLGRKYFPAIGLLHREN